jgi:hypothetical protein
MALENAKDSAQGRQGYALSSGRPGRSWPPRGHHLPRQKGSRRPVVRSTRSFRRFRASVGCLQRFRAMTMMFRSVTSGQAALARSDVSGQYERHSRIGSITAGGDRTAGELVRQGQPRLILSVISAAEKEIRNRRHGWRSPTDVLTRNSRHFARRKSDKSIRRTARGVAERDANVGRAWYAPPCLPLGVGILDAQRNCWCPGVLDVYDPSDDRCGEGRS